MRQRGDRARRPVANDGRTGVLRRWVLRTFGEEYLRKGHVLCVADGKGELAFEFQALNDIPAVSYDPRSLILNGFKRKLSFGFYHRNDVLIKYNSVPAIPKALQGIEAMQTLSRTHPRHIKGYFEMLSTVLSGKMKGHYGIDIHSIDGYTHLPLMLANQSLFDEGLEKGRRTLWNKKGLVEGCHEEDGGEGEGEGLCGDHSLDHGSDELVSGDGDLCLCTDGDCDVITSLDEARQVVSNCSIVLGMHPDQAVEHIIDFAIMNNKPFAVTPCCVYSYQFPARKLKNGSLVTSYSDLITYLLEKDYRIQQLVLDFEGRNIMLYFIPEGTVPLAAPEAVEMHVVKCS